MSILTMINPLFDEICKDMLPVICRMSATPRYAITLGGSFGKGLSDRLSDYDFRLYYECPAPESEWNQANQDLDHIIERWKSRGAEIDGVWARGIAEIDSELTRWLSGEASGTPYVWCVWGYMLPTDLYNQTIVEDPSGIAQAWKDRLAVYPDTLRDALLARHGGSLRYWRADYHYRSKVARNDAVFLASLTARLIHDLLQVIFALNRFYFPGDGHNLTLAEKLEIKPADLVNRVRNILYPGGPDSMEAQYENLMILVDDTLRLT